MHNKVLIEIKGNIQMQMKYNVGGTEQLYIINTITNEIFDFTKETYKTGTLITEILNRYDEIINIINEYISKLQEDNILTINDIAIFLEDFKRSLYDDILDIQSIQNLFNIRIYEFYQKLKNIENGNITGDKDYNTFQGFPRENSYIIKRGFTNYSTIKFLNNIKNSLNEVRKITERAFNLIDKTVTTIPFTKISADLPKMRIEFIDNVSNINSYIYEIDSIKDLFIACIYNLYVSNKFILRCQKCNKLFIPKTNHKNQKYCYSKNGDDYICREKGRKETYSNRFKNKSDNMMLLHNRIYNRIKRTELLKNLYLKNFNIWWNNLLNEFDTNNENDRKILHKKLVEYDKKLNKKHPSNKCKSYKLYDFYINNKN